MGRPRCAGASLDNLCVVIDYNKPRATTQTARSWLEPLAAKWRFDWAIAEIDGHDIPKSSHVPPRATHGRPSVIITNTVKAKAWKYMETSDLARQREADARTAEDALRQLGASRRNRGAAQCLMHRP